MRFMESRSMYCIAPGYRRFWRESGRRASCSCTSRGPSCGSAHSEMYGYSLAIMLGQSTFGASAPSLAGLTRSSAALATRATAFGQTHPRHAIGSETRYRRAGRLSRCVHSLLSSFRSTALALFPLVNSRLVNALSPPLTPVPTRSTHAIALRLWQKRTLRRV